VIQIRECRHGRLMFYDNDVYIGRSLLNAGAYSEEEILLWKQIIRPGWTVVEAGANIGAHTVWFSKAVGPGGMVHAFEPQRQMYQMLVGNLALNEITNVRGMHAALASSSGTARVPPIDYRRTENFGGFGLVHAGGEVAVYAVDDYSLLLDRVDFMKIDVEGMEADVIRGARETIDRCRPVLYVENDRTEKSRELIDLLRGFGYRLYWHLPYVNRQLFEDTVSMNMLCVHGENANVVGLEEVSRGRVETVREASTEHGAVL
jgi:FkbM family methyltransferase